MFPQHLELNILSIFIFVPFDWKIFNSGSTWEQGNARVKRREDLRHSITQCQGGG